MRLRVVLLSMALGVVVTGNARAYDGTGVIYDLSTLSTQAPSKPEDKGREGIGVTTPHDDRRDWGHERGRGHGQGNGRGRGHGGGRDGGTEPGDEREGNPSPTPEPGTMLLLGAGLAAGVRRFRKR